MADTPSSPFDWLQGGLFFGKNAKGGGIESVDSCKDVMSLLNGISENLNEILSPPSSSPDATTTTTTTADGDSDASKFLAARLSRLRFLLYDERRVTSTQVMQQQQLIQRPVVAGNTIQGLVNTTALEELIPQLLQNMVSLPFESRKHVTAIFNYLLVSGLDGADAELYRPYMEVFVMYVHGRFETLLDVIVRGHDTTQNGITPDIGLHFGAMYRSCVRHPLLYKELVGSTERATRYVFPFLDTYVHIPNFEISSDSMESLRCVFNANTAAAAAAAADQQQHQQQTPLQEETARVMAQIAAEFLTRDYVAIWDERYNPKLLSDSANYMTRRVALQILSSVLLTRSNYAIMIQYVASRENLILVMKLLRDTSPHITLDAFHVFKVFVANPNKPPEVIKILKDNQVKLARYLQTLHQDKEEMDTQFRDEKALIIATIEGL